MSALPLIAGLETGKTVSDECVHVIRYDADGKLMVFQTFEGSAAAFSYWHIASVIAARRHVRSWV
jgi:hypothetical protein